MRRGRATAIATALTAVSLAGAPSAVAATEVGSDCEASGMVVGATIFPVASGPGNSLPISVPTAGIATQWRVRSPGTDVHTERLKVFRQTPSPNQIQVVAESNLENVTDGQESFDIRIPVQPGDRFGVSGKPGEGAVACIPGRPGDVAGMFMGDIPPGSTSSFVENETFQAAVSAVVEPDVDGDGYGDETQDKCPQSTQYQTACPVIALAIAASAGKKSIVVQATTSSRGPVRVYGQVRWGFKPQKVRGRPQSRTARKLIVGLNGGTQTVAPGQIASFALPLPKSVKRRLGRMMPKESLKARVSASAPNLVGPVTTQTVIVRLKGRGHSEP